MNLVLFWDEIAAAATLCRGFKQTTFSLRARVQLSHPERLQHWWIPVQESTELPLDTPRASGSSVLVIPGTPVALRCHLQLSGVRWSLVKLERKTPKNPKGGVAGEDSLQPMSCF